MKTKSILLSVLLAVFFSVSAQHIGMSFQEAGKQGISITQLDKEYQSALHSDAS